ncbi:HlyD family secretion protein [Shewanella sp. Isolate13]|uniref:HlyD family secretion protein n=1 Tax=Shewanella sp. Isolate13 TaxID=2908531 RepID=UPI001EFDE4C0|nr:HlyD family secretion protein [Shewanella sp. Isolate13]MCG9729568.1 HlyD family secretion protein [Shewanella sp. Isolate13]
MAEGAAEEAKELAKKKGKKIRNITNSILALTIVSLAISIISDRIIPTTDNVRVEGSIVSLNPQVSGTVSDIKVQANRVVEKGDVLVQITPTDYQIAVKKAETELKLAGQKVGAQMADVLSAQAQLTNSLISQENARRQGQRIFAMVEKGVVSQSDADKTHAILDKADAEVLNAKANLERVQTQLGATGNDNAQIQVALLALQQAQLDLERTSIRAPSRGAVTNFTLSEGAYASAGAPLMTFVAKDGLWLEAYFRENSLGKIRPGDKVELTLDYNPGKVYEGTVSSIDLGVSWRANNQPGSLATVKNQTGWLRDSQRMPVSIRIENEEAMQAMRIGGQADVIVYTGDNPLFNLLGEFWIRLVSGFSYVR